LPMPLGYVPMAFGWALPMPLGGWVLVPNWKEGKSNQFWVHWSPEA
jgi:hypothetical protein